MLCFIYFPTIKHTHRHQVAEEEVRRAVWLQKEGQGEAALLKTGEGSGAKGRSRRQELDRPGRRPPEGS